LRWSLINEGAEDKSRLNEYIAYPYLEDFDDSHHGRIHHIIINLAKTQIKSIHLQSSKLVASFVLFKQESQENNQSESPTHPFVKML
jgi:hypothetical protein